MLKGALGRINSSKVQSAMEYLMTYGWSILLIAIVLAAVFELGVFNNNPLASSNTCIAQSGFLCSKLILNSTGVLNVTFGQSYGATYTITGVGCANSTGTAPSSFTAISSTPFYTGQQKQLNFQCPLTSNVIGTAFSGSLWIQYNTAILSGQTAKVGIVNVKVTTASSQGLSSFTTLLSVPISLTNLQGSSTGSNFQQMLTINSNQYSSYINGNWMNVEFTTGNAAAGTPGTAYQAWVEANATNTATHTTVWVSLPSGIPATSSTTIYMDMLASNVMSASGPTGEAPQLSPSYAEYDNGASVFTFYDNFAGNTLNSAWATQLPESDNSLSTVTVDNGITIYSGLSGRGYIYFNNYVSRNTWFESDITSVTSNIGSGELVSAGQNYYGYMFATQSNSVTWQNPGESASNVLSPALTLTTGVMGISWPSNSVQSYGKNYVQTNGTYSDGSAISVVYYSLGNFAGQYDTLVAHWARIRTYPPNGVMPTQETGLGAPSQILYYVPITLTNSQSSAVGAGMQVMVPFPASSYTSNEASNLQNVEFFYGNGTVVPSWLEGNIINEQSNALSTAANVIYWIKLNPPIAAGGGTSTVYAGFAPTSTNLFNTATDGEAPQLSCNNPANTMAGCAAGQYGEYDDGSTVFASYWNFAGSSLPSGFVQDQGSTANYLVSNRLYIQSNGSPATSIYIDRLFNSSFSLDTLAFLNVTTSSNNPPFFGVVTANVPSSVTLGQEAWWYDGQTYGRYYVRTTNSTFGLHDISISANGRGLNALAQPPLVFSVAVIPNVEVIGSLNYTSTATANAMFAQTTYNSIEFLISSNTINNFITEQWLRVRNIPSSGVLPSVSFGSFT